MSLQKMLLESEEYKTATKPKQSIYLVLAQNFEFSTEHLFFEPRELSEMLNVGTPDQWQEFLTLQTVQNFIKTQMAFLAQVSQRKTFKSLVQMALGGGQGAQAAAKQVQELSGILNQTDSNKVIIMHHIPRPKEKQNA